MVKGIQDIEQLRSLMEDIRNLKQGFVTNFYLDEDKHRAWIRAGRLSYIAYDDTIFLLFGQEGEFYNVFYISTSWDHVMEHLSANQHHSLWVLDIVGRQVMCQPITQSLETLGATHANTLIRMSRIGPAPAYERDNAVGYATHEDLPVLNEWLRTYFNPQLEQLPLMEELQAYVDRHWILKCTPGDKIVGFLIYEKNPSTLYLRYWFTHPEYRGLTIGSKLLHRFFEEGRDTRRQLLWVLQDNTNAIQRYEHYGFKAEDMNDYIYFYGYERDNH